MKDHIPYNPSVIEPKWQKRWKESKIYDVDLDTNKIVYNVDEDVDPKDDPHDEMLPKPTKPVKEK